MEMLTVDLFVSYGINLVWGLVAALATGFGIVIVIRMFDYSTKDVDEWQLIKDGNMPMAVILASVIIALGMVLSSVLGS